jgi:S1-C subfamily serine protease
VQGITKDGPCNIEELKEGYIITALDGEKITSFADIYELLEKYSAGDKAKLSFCDPNSGKKYEVEITLQADR